MLPNEEERVALKDWVVPRLEKIAEAEAGVLAEYVIALIAAEDTEEGVRKNCLESLSDFLHDHTEPFTTELLVAVKSKSFLPKATPSEPTQPSKFAPIPTSTLSAEAVPFNPPTGPSAPTRQQTRLPGLGGGQSRKRRYDERGSSQTRDTQDPHYRHGAGGDRPFKQTARRGGRNNRSGVQDMGRAPGLGGSLPAMSPMSNSSAVPILPPGFPADPMSFFAMMGMGLPGMPPMPFAASPFATNEQSPLHQAQSRGRKGRCRDYDNKGYCALGSACPYEHGGEIVLPPSVDSISNSLAPISTALRDQFALAPQRTRSSTDEKVPEYDPNQASLALEGTNGHAGSGRSLGRYEPAHGRRPSGRQRAPFSQAGPNHDRSNTTIVVEQIPEENFSEDAVRNFFSQFGSIVDVNMQAYKRLAIVKYDDHSAAQCAYDSPKVIFDNRFVKVYWYKPDSVPNPPASGTRDVTKTSTASADVPAIYNENEEMLDPEEFEKRQAGAQKAFEERQKKAQEAAVHLEEVQKKLQEKEEELRIFREKLAKKSSTQNVINAGNGMGVSKSDETDLLAQLSSLQAEAQNLGNNVDYGTHTPRGRGRGGYRGRGYYPPRGRDFNPYRGGYRGRGFVGAPFGGGRSGVRRLDNRPRRVMVTGVEAGSTNDEALRQHLVNNYEYESIDPHPDRADTQIVTFKERYIAEMFLYDAPNIPEMGKIELSWMPNASTTIKTEPSSDQAQPMSDQKTSEDDAKMDDQTESAEANGNVNGGEADYDVADDEDHWMVA